MNPRQCNRTYQTTAAAARAKVLAARQALADELETAPEEEPMRRFPHPIAPAAGACRPMPANGDSASTAQLLEQLCCQSQLLVDLLAAVNSLTAALLAQNNR